MLDNAGIPLEIIDGFIGSISVSVPWTALLSESCCMDIQGLEVTIMPRQRVDTGILSYIYQLSWCSGESAYLPPPWPGFDSQTCC